MTLLSADTRATRTSGPWRLHRLSRRRLASLAAALLGSTAAAAAPAVVDPTALPDDAATLVARVQEASARRSFSGTFVVSSNGDMATSRIVHATEGKDQIERIDSLDGQTRRLYRHNDLVHVLWPNQREARIQQRDSVVGFPWPTVSRSLAGISQYTLQPGGTDRVAGHEAWVVTLKPRDGLRFAQRWWIDRATGFLLRSDTLGEKGEVLETAAFSDIDLGTRQSLQALAQEMQRLDGYRVTRPAMTRTDLEREGWLVKTPVAGFEAVSCVRRPGLRGAARSIAPAAANASASVAASGPVLTSALPAQPAAPSTTAPANAEPPSWLQATFTDGLTQVSVFIEPHVPGNKHPDTPMAMGATHAVAQRVGDWWVTAVGDVPVATLKQFAQGLERRKP